MTEKLLKQYSSLAKFLSEVLGSGYEIVLHKIDKGRIELVEIFNPLSKRSIYANESDFVYQLLTSNEHLKDEFKKDFKIQTKDGKILHGSTFFIKENSELVGLLCINSDKKIYEDLAASILNLGGLSKELKLGQKYERAKNSELSGDLELDINTIISATIGSELLLSDLMPSIDQKKLAIKALYEKGIFNIKGAIAKTAKALKISEPSVYRYMSELKNKQKQEYFMFYI